MKENLRIKVMERNGQIEQIPLTRRQFAVFELAMWGRQRSQIADKLGISPSAVSHTFRRILNRLN